MSEKQDNSIAEPTKVIVEADADIRRLRIEIDNLANRVLCASTKLGNAIRALGNGPIEGDVIECPDHLEIVTCQDCAKYYYVTHAESHNKGGRFRIHDDYWVCEPCLAKENNKYLDELDAMIEQRDKKEDAS